MTIDLQSMKRLAELLAVDVLDQIEKDGGVNRVNLAEKLLAGLLLEAASKVIPRPDECVTIGTGAAGGGGGGGIYLANLDAAGAGGGRGGYFANLDAAGGRAVHLVCLCDECKRRREKSLCGCEMCIHHTEAAALVAEYPIIGLEAAQRGVK